MFLNPVMLAGIGGAAVPVVLHFISRSRFRSVDWGAMMFLEPGDVRQRVGGRTRSVALLLVRMAMIALLAVALARPVITGRWWQGGAAEHRLAVIVIDCSASMGVEEGGQSRLDSAKAAALRLLSSLDRGDQAALLTTGAGDTPDDRITPTTNLRTVASRIGDLLPGTGQADFAEALRNAAAVCELATVAGAGLDRDIYLFCDRQARSWDGVNDAFVRDWNNRPSAAAGLHVVPVGGRGAPDNVAIESVSLPGGPPIVGQNVDVEVQIHNFGRRTQAAVPVSLALGKQELFSNTVRVEPGASETVRALVRFDEAGARVLTAAIRSPDLITDNRLERPLTVLGPVKVLVVSGDEAGATPPTQADLLSLAMAPFGAGGGVNPANVTVVQAAKWDAAKLAEYQAVVLSNVPDLSDDAARRIEQYVYGGGGLLIAPGPRIRIELYNQLLFRNGAGVMPARLGPAVFPGVASTTLLGLTLDHPVFRFLKGSPNPVPAAAIGRYFPATPVEGVARILATFATGRPFLIEGLFGRGRVLLVTTSLDAGWGNLPWTSFYLPFIQSATKYVATANENAPPPPPPAKGVAAATESDLAVMTNEDWSRVRDMPGLDVIEVAVDSSADAASPFAGEVRRELWLPLMLVVVILAFIDTGLSRTTTAGARSGGIR